MANEEKEKIQAYFTEHGYMAYYPSGCHGSRNVASDGFFWYSVYLVKSEEDTEENGIMDAIIEVHEQDEEDYYYDELEATYQDDLYPFFDALWNDDDWETLLTYIKENPNG